MSINTTGTMTADMATYYDKLFLKKSTLNCHFYESAQKKPLPLNEGKTINFTRFLPIATRTTAITETTTGGIAEGSGASLKSMTVTATVAPYGNVTEITELLRLTSLDKNMKEKVEIMAMNAKETLDELMWREYGDNCLRIRADKDSTYEFEAAATNGSTTTIVDSTNLGVTDNTFRYGYATIVDRTHGAYGETRAISSSSSSETRVTVDAAFSAAVASGTRYRVSISTGLSNANSADKLTHGNLSYARRELQDKNALPFEGNFFRALVDPYSEFDFFASDSTLQGLSQQSKPGMLMDGVITRWMGIELRAQSMLWRHAVGTPNTYDSAGAIRVIPVFGREAIGAVDLETQGQKIFVQGWKDLGQPIPKYATIGWEFMMAPKVINGCWAIGLMVAPSA